MTSLMALLTLIFSAALLSADAGQQIYGVAEVKADILKLDGNNIQIRGWVKGCTGGLSCGLVASPDDVKGAYLSIAHVRSFEPQLTAARGQEIVLKAEVTKECTVNICTDRGPDLLPIRIMKIFDGA